MVERVEGALGIHHVVEVHICVAERAACDGIAVQTDGCDWPYMAAKMQLLCAHAQTVLLARCCLSQDAALDIPENLEERWLGDIGVQVANIERSGR